MFGSEFVDFSGPLGAILVLLGGISGAYGASDGYWTRKEKELVDKNKENPEGRTFAARAQSQGTAYEIATQVARRGDRGALLGWGFVIAGSIFLAVSEIFS